MKVRKISLRKMLFIILLTVFIAGDAILGFALYYKTKKMLIDGIKDDARDIVVCAAHIIDVDAFDRVHKEGEDFDNIYAQLEEFCDYVGIEYVFTLREVSGHVEYVVDTDPDPGAVGEIYQYTAAMRKAFAGEVAVDAEPYTDRWGTFIGAYCPITKDGEVIGVAAIDVSVESVQAQTRQLAILIIVICIIVLAVLIIALLLMVKNFTKIFEDLDSEIRELSEDNDDLSKRIELQSGDEFEVIAEHINQFIDKISKDATEITDDKQEAGT